MLLQGAKYKKAESYYCPVTDPPVTTPDLTGLNSCLRIKFVAGIIQKLGEQILAIGIDNGNAIGYKVVYKVGDSHHEVLHRPFLGKANNKFYYYQPGNVYYKGLGRYDDERGTISELSNRIGHTNLAVIIRDSRTSGKPIEIQEGVTEVGDACKFIEQQDKFVTCFKECANSVRLGLPNNLLVV